MIQFDTLLETTVFIFVIAAQNCFFLCFGNVVDRMRDPLKERKRNGISLGRMMFPEIVSNERGRLRLGHGKYMASFLIFLL
jgi:hypothetical protein